MAYLCAILSCDASDIARSSTQLEPQASSTGLILHIWSGIQSGTASNGWNVQQWCNCCALPLYQLERSTTRDLNSNTWLRSDYGHGKRLRLADADFQLLKRADRCPMAASVAEHVMQFSCIHDQSSSQSIRLVFKSTMSPQNVYI